MRDLRDNHWTDKISNLAQVGGIESSVLDNGAGRGNRMIWFDTGSGLRLKLLPDRALDIGEAFMNSRGLTWISQRGHVRPELGFQNGIEWLRTFGGGLITTCGLTQVGGPNEDEYGTRGLHGEISNISAEILQIVQPDPWRGEMEMFVTGKMVQSTVFGPHLELKRTIRGQLGSSVIRIEDRVMNTGNTEAPHMILYHMNFGWPLIDEGSKIIWEGEWKSRDSDMDRLIFREGVNFRACQRVRGDHAGGGEAACFIDPAPDKKGQYQFGVRNERLGLEVMMTAEKSQLPALTNWQHWGDREYVMGLEPGTHYPIGQKQARKEKNLIFLKPGETRQYELTIEVKENFDHQ